MPDKLFSTPVPDDLIEAVVNAFGLDSLDDARYFSRLDVARLGTADAVAKLVPALEEYYLPCKAKLYLADLTSASVMTVLRHLLRLVDRGLESREANVMMNGKPALRMSKAPGRYVLTWDDGRITPLQ